MSSGFSRDGGVSATESDGKGYVPATITIFRKLTAVSSAAKVEGAFSVEGKDVERFDYVFDLTGETRYDRPEIVSSRSRNDAPSLTPRRSISNKHTLCPSHSPNTRHHSQRRSVPAPTSASHSPSTR